MPLPYNESLAGKGVDLIARMKKEKDSVAALLKKVKDGYFAGTKVVLESGLKKADVQKILDAQEESQKLIKAWETAERTFDAELKTTYNERKAELEKGLKSLKGEYEEASLKFPRNASSVVGIGPEADFKKALPQLE